MEATAEKLRIVMTRCDIMYLCDQFLRLQRICMGDEEWKDLKEHALSRFYNEGVKVFTTEGTLMMRVADGMPEINYEGGDAETREQYQGIVDERIRAMEKTARRDPDIWALGRH